MIDGVMYRKFNIGGKEYVMKLYDNVLINNKYYTYVGKVNNKSEIPRLNCLYILDSKLCMRDIKRSIGEPIELEDKSENVSRGGNKPMDLEVRSEDDELMKAFKIAINKEGITVDQFKNCYGKDRNVDMRNDKRILDKKSKLSWTKNTEFLNMLGFNYRYEIYKEDENGERSIVQIDNKGDL